MARICFRLWLMAALVVPLHAPQVVAYYRVAISQQTLRPEQADEWILDASFGIAVKIASNSVTRVPVYSDRVMFLLIEDQYCSQELLRTVFTGLARRYPQPERLRIHVYSDPEMLRRAIVRNKDPIQAHMAFPDTPEGVELEEKIRGDLYIPKTGWARARYYRVPGGEETFVYKPDPQKVEMVEVVIKPPPVPKYTGKPQEDLFLATRLGDMARVQTLVDQGAGIDEKNKDQETPLIYAVRYNRQDIATLLLSRRAHVDAKNKYGQTALFEAIENKNLELVRLLLNHGADVNARYGDDITPLISAAYRGNVDLVAELVQSGASVSRQDGGGRNALMWAVENRSNQMVELLLRSGANANVVDKRGNSALSLAEKVADPEILRLLRAAAGR